jgi:hypothetical protein
MTAEALTAGPAIGRVSPSMRSRWALARVEARRMLTNPAYAVLLAFILLSTGGLAVSGDQRGWLPTRPEAYDRLQGLLVLYAGLATYVVAHLVSTSARRSGAQSQLASAPAGERSQSLGLVLGIVRGPLVVAAGLLVVLAWLGNDVRLPSGQAPLSGLQLVQIALMVLGGGVFGVMVATWLRFPASLLLGLFTLVFVTGWLGGDAEAYAAWLPPLVPFITAADWFDAVPLTGAVHAWHTVYMCGLCGLGVVAAALHDPARRVPWIITGAVVLTVTAAAAAAQA